jgi:hypothetical protein
MKSEGVFDWNGHLCVGNRLPLELPKLVVLNSAQSKYPLGGDEWILGTREALESYVGERQALVCSLGLNTWEFTTWSGGTNGYPLIITVLWDGTLSPLEVFQATTKDLSLSEDSTTMVLLPTRSNQIKESGPYRDQLVASMANLVVPISIRTGGRMEALLAGISMDKIDPRFTREWKRTFESNHYHFDMETLKKDVDPRFTGWLVHWTRACPGPWPGETRAEYFKSVIENREEYAHSARRTLLRIASEKRIRSSPWRIRGKESVVCLSGLPPSQATHLMRWRSRYVRYAIEPFGIGISGKTASRIEIEPVQYLESGMTLPDGIPAFLLQRSGRGGHWPQEVEYRHCGEIDLETLAADEWEAIDLTRSCLT